MKKFFAYSLMLIGAITLISMAGTVGFGLFALKNKHQIEQNTILETSFERDFPEYLPEDKLGRSILGKSSSTLREVIEALESAASDPRISGLIVKVGEAGMGFAQIQELREAVLHFRKSGKPAYAYSDTFGEFGPGNRSYYLASAFGKIYLQPSGDIGLSGLMFQTHFIKGTLDKLGIAAHIDHRQEYKNAPNTFTQTKYTAPHKEALQQVMKSLFGQMLNDIAKDRQLSTEEIRTLADQGMLLGKEALDAKLADRLGYRDEAYQDIRKQTYVGANLMSLSEYINRTDRPESDRETLALIYGTGGIRRGKSEYHPFSGDASMGADTIAAAFRSAAEDKKVRAIVFRVDSPGGSYIASDTIWREVNRAKEAGKPVIVSMGNVAASGGYFVAMAADKIVAEPATITGSIGVFAGKMLSKGLMDKIGITTDEIHTSENSTLWTSTQDYTPAQWKRIQAALDRIYEDFTGKVADGRKLPKDIVMKIAKGRIWTGEDAQQNGLVDELGGLNKAIEIAKKIAGISAESEVRLKMYPEKKNFIEMILNREADTEDNSGDDAMIRALKEIQPIVRSIRSLGIGESPDVLALPESELFQ